MKVYLFNRGASPNIGDKLINFVISKDFSEMLLAGLKEKLNWAISERINRLEGFCHKMKEDLAGQMNTRRNPTDSAIKQGQELIAKWSQLKDLFDRFKAENGNEHCRDTFLETIRKGIMKSGLDYIAVIQQLAPSDGALATEWLQGIVDHIVKDALNIIPSFSH